MYIWKLIIQLLTSYFLFVIIRLTHKQLKTNDCVISSVAAVALALKHQAISTHGADEIRNALEQFQKYGFTLNNTRCWNYTLKMKQLFKDVTKSYGVLSALIEKDEWEFDDWFVVYTRK